MPTKRTLAVRRHILRVSRAGGHARAAALSPARRSAIARKAARALWRKRRAAAKRAA